MDYKSDIRDTLKDSSKIIDLTTLITSIIHLYGENSTIDESVLENILISMLSEDGYNIALYINNVPEARYKLNWHYDVSEGEGYITLK
jgi:hypothetical protein